MSNQPGAGNEHHDLLRLEGATNPDFLPGSPGTVSQAKRMGYLAGATSEQSPPRRVNFGEADPYGLLGHEDTYERMAGHLFEECEGIYRKLAAVRPEVGKQARAAMKGKRGSVTLPPATLMEIYEYELVRTQDSASTHYLFHRKDRGYEDHGFRIVKKEDDDHVVINNLGVAKDYTKDDEEYFKLLTVAKKWLHDYAGQMNLEPRTLRALAELDFKPYGPASRAKLIGKNVLQSFDVHTRPVRDTIMSVATVKPKEKARRPRFAALAVVAACVPVSNGILATEAASTLANAWNEVTKSGPGFDSHHYQLPPDAASRLGAINHRVAFDPELSNVIYNNAPPAGGRVAVGQIRSVDPSTGVFDSNNDRALQGIGRPNCKTINVELPGAKSVKVVNTNPTMRKGLTVTATAQSLTFCNHTHHVMHESNTHIFIQPEA